jgi:hypothetical protein
LVSRHEEIAHVDQQGALMLHNEGWELAHHPFLTREEAEQEKPKWQATLDKLSGK